jgi:hypothetical protein
MAQYQSGQIITNTLTGSELVSIDTGGAVLVATTTGAIAELATNFSNDSPTAVTTNVGTTFTTAQLLTGLLNRTGPTANFTDVTPTAAQFATALNPPSYPVSFYVNIKNATAFTETITAGTGITFSSNTVIPPNTFASYLVVLASATAASFNHLDSGNINDLLLPSITALATVGAGTITGTGIAAGITSRTGSQTNTAFTDTTDTAANIIAAMPNVHVGNSWIWSYQNTTNAPATIGGGTGVTVSGITVVPAGATADFLVTYTAANTLTAVGYRITHPSTVDGTFVANGATAVVVANTNVTANSVIVFTMKTVGGTPAGAPFLSAVTAGTGFSVKAAAGDTSTYNYLILN